VKGVNYITAKAREQFLCSIAERRVAGKLRATCGIVVHDPEVGGCSEVRTCFTGEPHGSSLHVRFVFVDDFAGHHSVS
jgi:hypothetical protein